MDAVVDNSVDDLFDGALKMSSVSQSVGHSFAYPRTLLSKRANMQRVRAAGDEWQDTNEARTEQVFGKTIVAQGRYVEKGYVGEGATANAGSTGPALAGGAVALGG